MNLVVPEKYFSILNSRQTILTVQKLKDYFSTQLKKQINLNKVTAPSIIEGHSGISDNYGEIAPPVKFKSESCGEKGIEIIRSVTKWKREYLSNLDLKTGEGIFAEIVAIRPDEGLSNIHSLQVDQWDWELILNKNERSLSILKKYVRAVYKILKEAELFVNKMYPEILPVLPAEITFIHAEELVIMFSGKTPEQREYEAAKKFGSIFIIGIGHQLSDGKTHGIRTADYDDWSTENDDGFLGLNGDLIFWNPVLQHPIEISSMGIRVNKEALLHQVEIFKCHEILTQPWHKKLLNGEMPQTIGGGIGMSRTMQFLLRKAHIGEVQPSVWPDEMELACKKNNIFLL